MGSHPDTLRLQKAELQIAILTHRVKVLEEQLLTTQVTA